MSEGALVNQQQAPGNPRGLSAAALKWFAIVTMLIEALAILNFPLLHR